MANSGHGSPPCGVYSPLRGIAADAFRAGLPARRLRAAHTALTAGADLPGISRKVVRESIEWAEGDGKRFGIVHAGDADRRRLPKDGAQWFGDAIARD